jgi:hypothetical protein
VKQERLATQTTVSTPVKHSRKIIAAPPRLRATEAHCVAYLPHSSCCMWALRPETWWWPSALSRELRLLSPWPVMTSSPGDNGDFRGTRTLYLTNGIMRHFFSSWLCHYHLRDLLKIQYFHCCQWYKRHILSPPDLTCNVSVQVALTVESPLPTWH